MSARIGCPGLTGPAGGSGSRTGSGAPAHEGRSDRIRRIAV